jgi:hypothetical protein
MQCQREGREGACEADGALQSQGWGRVTANGLASRMDASPTIMRMSALQVRERRAKGRRLARMSMRRLHREVGGSACALCCRQQLQHATAAQHGDLHNAENKNQIWVVIGRERWTSAS